MSAQDPRDEATVEFHRDYLLKLAREADELVRKTEAVAAPTTEPSGPGDEEIDVVVEPLKELDVSALLHGTVGDDEPTLTLPRGLGRLCRPTSSVDDDAAPATSRTDSGTKVEP